MNASDIQMSKHMVREEQADVTITDATPIDITILAADGRVLHVNQFALNRLGLNTDDVNDGYLKRICHPDELNLVLDERRTNLSKGIPFKLEMRLLSKSGEFRWHLAQYNPLADESGRIIRWYVTAIDIDDRKRFELMLKKSEEDLRIITDAIRQVIVVLAPDGTTVYANKVACEQTGLTLDELLDQGFAERVFHSDDVDGLRTRKGGLELGRPFELELRALQKTGEYRWKLVQYNPLKDERGQIIRWYATSTDIEDQKRTEERLRNENLVLREEIDRSSMFDEIVGTSKSIRHVVKQVEKVAQSDSTVLILGETGTGKELIARSLHRRSKRANRAFVRVNCAAIPQSLIASELFGHERGAFTGALQRRVGRFEAANGGTLFLDEVGDLPMETQITLLRVLQEKEFERVGSNIPISVDVRLVAATNRDLPAAVVAGTFRQDLFYRLNVVPIAIPPLRERSEDIPLLVENFVARFAKATGKDLRRVTKQTMEQLKRYPWPGNIRELQNVVERAVTLSETDTFAVDEDWLKHEVGSIVPSKYKDLSALERREVETIEAALAESHGRISGPAGAAAKLGIPRQTLEGKLRRLGIGKYGPKRSSSY